MKKIKAVLLFNFQTDLNFNYKHELDSLKAVQNFAYSGEASCVVLDAYAGKRRTSASEENVTPPNAKRQKPLTRKVGAAANNFCPKPKLSDYIQEADFVGKPPTYAELNIFMENMRDARHGIDHLAKYQTVKELREKYEELENSLANLQDDGDEVIKKVDGWAKKLAPNSTCPDLETIRHMKPYF